MTKDGSVSRYANYVQKILLKYIVANDIDMHCR